jgi:hypothetical protein
MLYYLHQTLQVHETIETPVTSTCLSFTSLEWKTDRMSNKLLCTKSVASYKHRMQMMIEHYYI